MIPRVSRRAPASDGKQWRMRKRKLPPRGGGDERRYHARVSHKGVLSGAFN